MQKVVMKLEKGHTIIPGTLPGRGKHNSVYIVESCNLGSRQI